MQDHDDRPAGAGRPSLLSSASQADAQAEPDRQRILSSLDNGPRRAAPVRAPRPRPYGWVWGAAALGAVAVALLVFVAGEGDEPVVPETVHAAAPAAVHAAAGEPGHVAAREPAAGAPAAASEGAGAAPTNPLADMTPTPTPAPAAKHARSTAAADPLTRALENKQARHSPAAKSLRDVKQVAAAPAKASPKPKPARQRAQSEPDSDVLLLAALIGHMEPRNKKATLGERLESCKRYNSAGEEQCRARVCGAAERKEPACKGVPRARTAPDT